MMLRRRSRPAAKTPLRRAPLRTGRRDTGPDRATRELVLERDQYRCVACGAGILSRWYSIQHRKARGVGGGNDPANLITLCGSATSPGCHLWCERRAEQARDAGYWVPSWDDPAAVPVRHAGYGLVYLWANGAVSPVDGAA
jgi:hypothetical protein